VEDEYWQVCQMIISCCRESVSMTYGIEDNALREMRTIVESDLVLRQSQLFGDSNHCIVVNG